MNISKTPFSHNTSGQLLLYRVFVSIYFWKIWKVKFALKCLHFFIVVKQSLLFGKLLSLEKKLCSKKWTHTFSWDFFSLWIRNWYKQCEEKKIPYDWENLLFKTIIVFTSIYFESYCKIPAQSTKSKLSFYHKIYLHVKGILNQNKHI